MRRKPHKIVLHRARLAQYGREAADYFKGMTDKVLDPCARCGHAELEHNTFPGENGKCTDMTCGCLQYVSVKVVQRISELLRKHDWRWVTVDGVRYDSKPRRGYAEHEMARVRSSMLLELLVVRMDKSDRDHLYHVLEVAEKEGEENKDEDKNQTYD